mmetsp:Transcript_6657/g.6512  ORF Transcript_6657/g.6512 Transcript_6657/m.6512 type:complete len:202 (-) Transcript_6657:361-966(-)
MKKKSKMPIILKPLDSSFGVYLPLDSPRSALLPSVKFPDIFNAVISEAVSRSRSHSEVPKCARKEPKFENNTIVGQAIEGIFKILPQNAIGEVKVYDLVRFFISLNLSASSKSIVSIFTIDESRPFNMLTISKHHLLMMCDDSYSEKTLTILISEHKKSTVLSLNHRSYRVKNPKSEFDQLLAAIHNIWDKIDKDNVGYLF